MEKTIQIIGKRWFDKKNGNTYHSVEVYEDNKFIGKNPFEYGYDEQYIQSAFKILQNAGIYPKTNKRLLSGLNEDYYNFQQERRSNRDKFLITVSDVSRRKDL